MSCSSSELHFSPRIASFPVLLLWKQTIIFAANVKPMQDINTLLISTRTPRPTRSFSVSWPMGCPAPPQAILHQFRVNLRPPSSHQFRLSQRLKHRSPSSLRPPSSHQFRLNHRLNHRSQSSLRPPSSHQFRLNHRLNHRSQSSLRSPTSVLRATSSATRTPSVL